MDYIDAPPHPLGPWKPGRGGRPRLVSGPPSCRGGRTHIDHHGYVREYAPDHPHAHSRGDMMQHRLVAECIIGRLLEPEEIVHHRNHVKSDNSVVNLAVMPTRRDHGLEHADDIRALLSVKVTEDQVREALVGRTTLEAAEFLGVSHQTLRLRFDHLLTKRVSPGGLYPDELVERVRVVAADPMIGTVAASRILGLSQFTVRTIRERHGIAWVSLPIGRPPSRP